MGLRSRRGKRLIHEWDLPVRGDSEGNRLP